MKYVLMIVIFSFSLYFSIASFIFLANNPTANEIQVYIHFSDVINFNKLEKFSIKD